MTKTSFEYQNDKSRSSSLYNTTSFYPLAALALAACGGGGGGGSSPTPDPEPRGGNGNGDPVATAPVLTVGGTQATLNEGTFAADTPTGHTVTASDDDGDNVVFTVTGDNRFNIVNNELVIVANSVFDFETESSITLTITASDGATTVTEEVTITITDAPEAPVLSVGGSQTLTLNEEETITAGTATGYTVSATDEDGDNVALSVDDARFTIADDGSLNIAADSEFDFETEPTITLTITATDDSTGLLTDTQTVIISITNVDFSTILTSINVGSGDARTAPAFGDVDGDGDMDLLIGEDDGILNFFRWGTATDTADNPGSGWSDQTAALTGSLAPLATDFGDGSTPGFADVDGDGDMDLLVGEEDSGVDYLRWGGDDDDTATTPATGWTAQTAPSPLAGDVIAGRVAYATPAYGDVDGDGDDDLLFGSFFGPAGSELNFYRWGTDSDTAASPGSGWTAPVDDTANAATLTALGFSDIPDLRIRPAFGDVDGDGDLDLLVGGQLNVAFFRRGPGEDAAGNTIPIWGAPEAAAGWPDGLAGVRANTAHATPRFGDVDGDGDMDLVIGQRDGNLDIFYRNVDEDGTETWSQTSDII